MNLREAAQQALEALEALEVWRDCLTDPRAMPEWRFAVVGEKAITALRAALAEDRVADIGKTSDHFPGGRKMVATIRPEVTVEPVAWIGRLEGGIEYGPYHKAALKLPDGVRFDLYTAPPKRKPLTDEEISNLELPPNGCTMRELVRVVERAHGIGGEE